MKKSNQIPLFILVLFIGFFSSLTYWIGINQGEILTLEKDQNKWTSVNVVLDNLLNNYVDSLDSYSLSENSINNILKDLDPHIIFRELFLQTIELLFDYHKQRKLIGYFLNLMKQVYQNLNF